MSRNLITVKTKHGFLRLTPEEHQKRHLDRPLLKKEPKAKPDTEKPEEPEGEQ